MEIKTLKDLKKEIADAEKLVLVEFWGSWCPPCQRMKEIMEELEQEEQVKILRANPDMNSSFSSEYDIKGLPTFVFFGNGKELQRELGARSKGELRRIINDLVNGR